jgi:hypothetical protein
MSRQTYHCPKCSKVIRRISMSGGSLVDQGLQVPDPDDFTITLHPCCCSASKPDPMFAAFVSSWKKAYAISDSPVAMLRVPAKPITTTVPPFQRPVTR